MRISLILAAVTLSGCARDGGTPLPYTLGQTWTAQRQVVSTTTSYKNIEGEGPVASKGTLGFGSNCSTARSSAGTLTETVTALDDLSFEVVGNTVAHHPLKPGEDGFNKIGVSVVNEWGFSTAEVTSVESTLDPEGEVSEFTVTTKASLGGATGSVYAGVAADEYVVRLFPLDLWSEWDEGEFGDGAEPNEFQQSADGDRNFELMTKHKPKKGDVWTSESGLTFFSYDGSEKYAVGGKNEDVDRVLAYTNGNLDASGGGVLERCLVLGPLEVTNSADNDLNVLTQSVVVDPGCDGRFEHQRVGLERWYNNALLSFEGTQVFVTINDFGWEYFEDGEDTCVRIVDDVKPTDAGDAKLFVEYSVEVVESTYTVDSWEIAEPEVE
jgi:hypothetical protein